MAAGSPAPADGFPDVTDEKPGGSPAAPAGLAADDRSAPPPFFTGGAFTTE